MAADAGAEVLETNNDGPKIPDKKKTKFDVIIIGAGPSGYTAGIYCSRAGYDTLILSGILPGGQLVNTTEVENYPGFENGIMGPDLMIDMRKQSQRMGTTIIDDVAVDVDFRRPPYKVLTGSEEYESKAVIIATGANPKKMGITGEEEFSGRGVSYCATCDGNFFTDQDVVVVGGGDAAIDEGLYLTGMAKTVTVVHRRDKLKASPIMQNRAFAEPKMEFRWNHVVEEIKGNGGGVEKLLLRNVKDNKVNEIYTNGVFIYIGFYPNSGLLKGLMDMDSGGHVITDIRMGTSIPGVFACGDIRQYSDRQLGTAVGDGITAALSAYRFIKED